RRAATALQTPLVRHLEKTPGLQFAAVTALGGEVTKGGGCSRDEHRVVRGQPRLACGGGFAMAAAAQRDDERSGNRGRRGAGVQNSGRRETRDAVGRAGRAAAVTEHGEGPAVAADERARVVQVVAVVNADEVSTATKAGGEALKPGRLFLARVAPAGPEVDQGG